MQWDQIAAGERAVALPSLVRGSLQQEAVGDGRNGAYHPQMTPEGLLGPVALISTTQLLSRYDNILVFPSAPAHPSPRHGTKDDQGRPEGPHPGCLTAWYGPDARTL